MRVCVFNTVMRVYETPNYLHVISMKDRDKIASIGCHDNAHTCSSDDVWRCVCYTAEHYVKSTAYSIVSRVFCIDSILCDSR